MSKWTHVLGVIRFESGLGFKKGDFFNREERLNEEQELVSRFFNGEKLPSGSEGGIEVNYKMSHRGPLAILTGDLRDFGDDADLKEIVDALNDCLLYFEKEARKKEAFIHLRDSFISLNVGYAKKTFLIKSEYGDNGYIFILKIYGNKQDV